MSERVSDTRSAPAPRLHWIDLAKACAVVLVVIYHVGAGLEMVIPNGTGSASDFWAEVNRIALPLRMPLFFLVAGMLAHTAVSRRWSAVVRPRIFALLWPYVLWTVAFACVAGAAYRPDDPIAFGIERLKGLPFARAGYWFLLVLAVFFVAAKLLQRWAPLALTLALLVSVAAPWLEAQVFPSMHWLVIYGITKVARYAFWYLLGCYGFREVSRLSHVNPLLLIAGGGAAFGALTWLATSASLAAELSFALSAAGVIAMIGVSAWGVRFETVRRTSRYLASRTLPIYLIHPLLIVLIIVVARLIGVEPLPDDALATLLTPLIAVLLLIVSVIVYDRLSKSRVAWVFAPPAWTDRLLPAPARLSR